jgi:hypothetical protein
MLGKRDEDAAFQAYNQQRELVEFMSLASEKDLNAGNGARWLDGKVLRMNLLVAGE